MNSENIWCKQFVVYLSELRTEPNKVGYLMDAFKEIHSNLPSEDLETKTLAGKMAQIWKLCNKDSGRALQLIWKSSADNPVGSHLDYILGMVKNVRFNNKQIIQQPRNKLVDAKDVIERTREKRW